jgi:hypothetical protein
MSVYTISPDLLRNIEKDEGIYLSDILFVFTTRGNDYKVSKDRNGDVINSYKAIGNNGDIIKVWLDLMSFKPSPFYDVDVDLSQIACEETRFMKVCKEVKVQNKLIMYSHQNLKKYECPNNKVNFENKIITVLDKDEAKNELTNTTLIGGDTIINSQVVKDGSIMMDSKNK